MQLRRMLLTLFLAGLCCVSLAACTPDNTPSEPESSSSGDTLTTTLLPAAGTQRTSPSCSLINTAPWTAPAR